MLESNIGQQVFAANFKGEQPFPVVTAKVGDGNLVIGKDSHIFIANANAAGIAAPQDVATLALLRDNAHYLRNPPPNALQHRVRIAVNTGTVANLNMGSDTAPYIKGISVQQPKNCYVTKGPLNTGGDNICWCQNEAGGGVHQDPSGCAVDVSAPQPNTYESPPTPIPTPQPVYQSPQPSYQPPTPIPPQGQQSGGNNNNLGHFRLREPFPPDQKSISPQVIAGGGVYENPSNIAEDLSSAALALLVICGIIGFWVSWGKEATDSGVEGAAGRVLDGVNKFNKPKS